MVHSTLTIWLVSHIDVISVNGKETPKISLELPMNDFLWYFGESSHQM
ncbi:unnamed protein product [Brassica rapa]|uniref:Uncharacterized protein n=1 Tax=Brassica campestris TaxID=3711 RepID=A0A3P5YJV2_BRACM|nr:unnamed protein product [Brassica rapa]VDC67449.1 unnamed protein product [Brassica rapa]